MLKTVFNIKKCILQGERNVRYYDRIQFNQKETNPKTF